ncbi:family 31 glycosyl hydrolase, alpha-glucosidase [Caldisphaera lagunensis DSM 15908]|uniref:Family 31 glycosyl hydrolase, alpha-glucosidase n=1 Tax=Caldisphaera lagunensis (strain DSM 15908 / JCM 11604 / ANMR 0165 / IC-154) TaxID=1056495 RepID=L0AB52_CALLD|nr:TIM-barrel domain-containing protein [Caldisphaera lagunensis]AFZ70644.1 family 31 glycosyl hydrolase, alpha-glucosidase [Caldisphaera lagunensis DSM 15908]
MATLKFDETKFKPISFHPYEKRFFKDGCIYSDYGKICFSLVDKGIIRIGNNIEGNTNETFITNGFKISILPKLTIYNNEKILEEWGTGEKEGDRSWFDPLFDPELMGENKSTITTGLLTCKDGKTCYSFALSLSPNEPIYGLGEHFGHLNKRGFDFITWAADMPSTPNYATYIPIPFIWSPKGWAILINTSSPVYFDLGKASYDRLLIITRGYFDAYLFLGNVKELFKSLYKIAGKPSNELPKWSFGFWQSKCAYKTQEEVLNVSKELRNRGYPGDVIHIDPPWEGNWDKYGCDTIDLEWDEKAFPNPEEMIKKLHEMGFKLSLWINPYIEPETKLWEAMKNKLMKSKNGGKAVPLADCQTIEKAGIPDLFDKEGFETFKNILKEKVLKYADVIKADYGEGVPYDAISNGLSGEELHNLFSLYYMKAVYDATKETKGYGIVWGRSGYTGVWQYPLQWGGDTPSSWEGLRQAIRGLLSFHSSGSMFASFDVGGFIGKPSEELYIRWLQAGIMVSHVRAHGNSEREPWKYNEEITKKILKLRYKLLPYIYSESIRSVKEEIPLIRPLFFENHNDPNTYNIDDEYYFGKSLLVAPITQEGNRRKVYLPSGEYFEFFSDKIYEGNKWYDLTYDLDKFPLFVKYNSIIPMLSKEISYIEDKKYFDELEFHVYGKDAEMDYYDYEVEAKIVCKNGECNVYNLPKVNYKFIFH